MVVSQTQWTSGKNEISSPMEGFGGYSRQGEAGGSTAGDEASHPWWMPQPRREGNLDNTSVSMPEQIIDVSVW